MTAALSPMTRADVVTWRIRHARLTAAEAAQILAHVAETFPAIVAAELDQLEQHRNPPASTSLRSVPPSLL